MLTPYFVSSRRSLLRLKPTLNDKFKMSIISKAIIGCFLLFMSFSNLQAQRLYVFTWLDANSDGHFQFGEIAEPNVTVNLYNCSGSTPINTFTTNAGGELWIAGLTPGASYKISVVRPPAKFYTYENVGGDDVTDSDIYKNGFSDCFSIVAGDTSEILSGFVSCPPVGSLKCQDQVNVSLAPYPACTGDIIPETILSSKTQCSNSFKVELTTLAGAVVPNPITANYIGQTLMATVRDTMYSPSQSCWGFLNVEYKIAPKITSCSGDTLRCYDGTPAATNITYRPAFTSCNPSAYLTYKDSERLIGCTGDPLSGRFKRVVERTWYARDTNGFKGKVMVDSCVQRFYFRSSTFADVNVPTNLTLACNTAFTPDANGNPTPTGVFTGPTIAGISLWNNVTHPCMFNAIYTDQTVPMCKGSKKVIRSWRVVDWCTSEYRDYIQFIELIDNVKPTVTCPSNVTISTDNNSCYGTMSVPSPTVSDQCSGEWTLKYVAPTGRIVYNEVVTDLRVGLHTITWTAEDPCGNTNTCSFNVTVRDQVGPTPVCEDNLVVTLDKVNGEAKIFTKSFDKGSHDNCGIATYKARRLSNSCIPGGTAFADSVRFVCCDVPTPVMVELLVTDSSGNSNSCMMTVNVLDKLAPTIVCPTNVTVGCDDARLPNQFGKVVTLGQKRDTVYVNGQRLIDGLGFDNCNQVFITNTDSTIRACGDGFIRRVFTIRDINNLTASCTQTITIVNDNKYSANDIDWPLDYSTTNCAAGIDAANLPAGYNKPKIKNDRCGMMIISEPEDVIFPVSAPACFKVYRKWRVIDMCQYNPNISTTVGTWEYTQLITVTDNQKPVFTFVPSSFNVDIAGTGCVGSATIPTPTVTDCKPNIVPTVGVFQGSTKVASGYGPHSLQVGNYTVVYTAEDGCGNVSTAQINFVVRDKKKPTPLAFKGLAIDLMPTTGQVTISADKFENGSSDNCTAYANLSYRLGRVGTPNQTTPPASASVTLTCADLGQAKIDFWVGDESGNWDYVTTFIDVQNNMGANCGGTGTANVTGTILSHTSSVPVENVEVGTSISNTIKGLTNVSGQYTLNKLVTGKNVSVLPQNNTDWMNGVTTLDLVLINQHILGTNPLNSPYKMIAADVAKDDKISTLDLVMLRKLILGQITEVSGNMSWRFINSAHKFQDNNPFDEQCPSTCEINPLTADAVANFVAIKTGDVNGSAKYNSSTFTTSIDRSASTLVFETEDQELKAGQIYKVNFKVKAAQLNVNGFQFTTNFDSKALDFVDINTKNQDLSLANFGLAAVKEGTIITSWNSMTNNALNNDEVLFEMTFKAKTNGQLSDLLSVGSRVLDAEAYNLSNEIMKVELQFNGKSKSFELYQNQPNPFKATTVISFSLPTSGFAKLSVLDAAGRTLKVIEGDFAKGYNEVQLQANELKGIGVLYYRLDTSFGSATKKMVVLE